MEKVLKMLIFKDFIKRQSFLYQRRSLKGSAPNSWYNFSLDVPLIAPIIQNKRWIDFSLSSKELLKVWSFKIFP